MKQQQLWLLIANKLTGEASAHDLLLLDHYLQTDSVIRHQVEVLVQLWEQPKCLPEKMPAKTFESIMKRISQL